MARNTFNLGSKTYTPFNGFSSEYLVSPHTLSTTKTNVTGAVNSSASPVRISQFTLYFTSSSGGVIRMRIANSSSGTDGYADTVTRTARGDERDFPNLAKFAGDTIYYGFSKGDSTTTTYYAGSGGVIYARVGSDQSNRTLHATFVVDSVPNAPTGLSGSATSSSSVFLSWTAPTDTGGIPLIGYRVLKSTNGGSTWTYATTSSGTTATVSGLSASTTYTFKVAGYNNVSEAHGGSVTSTSYHTGTNSRTTSVTTPSDALPPEVQIQASALDQDSIYVEWQSTLGNRTPNSVSVTRNDTGQVFSNAFNDNQTFNGLTPNTSYTYTIVASNDEGTDAQTGSARTLNYVPTITGSATAIDSTSARVVWETQYADTVTVSGTNLNSTELSGNVIVEGLEPGGIYQWNIIASNNDFSNEANSNRVQLPNVIGGVWNGSDWAIPDIKRWGGSAWGDTEVYVWTGSEWKLWA